MPPLCNANAVITCPHGTGVIQAVPSQSTVLVGGAPALRATDPLSWAVLPGCTQLPTPATPAFVPCAKVLSVTSGQATKVMVGGVPALLGTAVLVTSGLPVGTPSTVAFPGQALVQGA